ncbi:MAG: chemotaxis protein CheW [Candidatus Glassbacteria bacterium]|nr:chemotaxis protein CheW [Candidatus Glassbacteria bacterium]
MYALPADEVREILGPAFSTRCPSEPDRRYQHTVNIRGKLIEAVDLHALLGHRRHHSKYDSSVVLIEKADEKGGLAGLMVDQIGGLLEIKPDDIIKVNGESLEASGYIKAVADAETGTVHLLNTKKLFLA